MNLDESWNSGLFLSSIVRTVETFTFRGTGKQFTLAGGCVARYGLDCKTIYHEVAKMPKIPILEADARMNKHACFV